MTFLAVVIWPLVACLGLVFAFSLVSQWIVGVREVVSETEDELERVKAAIESQQVGLNRLDAAAAVEASARAELEDKVKRLAALIPQDQRNWPPIGVRR